jgi:endonuclease I
MILVASCHPDSIVVSAQDENDTLFSGCSINDYYLRFQGESLTSWTRPDIAQLLKDTHLRVLPYTSSSRVDVWDALVDLDAGVSFPNSVHLIYRDVDVSSKEYGTPSTWNREHLWPKSLGVGYSGPDYTDIHALRPSDWNVNSARGNLFFGDCDPQCTYRPATSEAAPDTAKNDDVFLLPANVRGDVARALLYMELRYFEIFKPEKRAP